MTTSEEERIRKSTTKEGEEHHRAPSSAFEMAKAASSAASTSEFYQQLIEEVKSLLDGERDHIANAANLTSLLYHQLNARKHNLVNWCGFYFLRPDQPTTGKQQLVLGPFQGLPACIRINPGRGVCGGAISRKETLRVDDVHCYPGHIACDSASTSELVIPFFVENEQQQQQQQQQQNLNNGVLGGVLDLDSPHLAAFTEEDQTHLELIVKLFLAACDWH